MVRELSWTEALGFISRGTTRVGGLDTICLRSPARTGRDRKLWSESGGHDSIAVNGLFGTAGERGGAGEMAITAAARHSSAKQRGGRKSFGGTDPKGPKSWARPQHRRSSTRLRWAPHNVCGSQTRDPGVSRARQLVASGFLESLETFSARST